MGNFTQNASNLSYDVVLIGGAIYGSSIAWFLSENEDFNGTILVVEKDPSYEFCSTSHTNSCIRQQFSQKLNIALSQFGADFIRNFKSHVKDTKAPNIKLQSFGYLYLANTEKFANYLQSTQKTQMEAGAKTKFLNPEEIKELYPFYNVQDIIGANHNVCDEGYFDGSTIFSYWKSKAKTNGVLYLRDEVVNIGLNKSNTRIEKIGLKSGRQISAGIVVNSSGTRAALTAKMAGIKIPVEPRKRYSFIFKAQKPLPVDLPLTIDPSGVHFRSDGNNYLAGCAPTNDHAVDHCDFDMDYDIWQTKIWPVIAKRIPQFDALKVLSGWAGHYAYNTLDQNAILGYHSTVGNFIFVNGFSGHGLQHSPGIGRGISELITYNEYKSLDLSPLDFSRVEKNEPFSETAII
ncbi:MAG: FAD-binding oxidoreductase [Pseudomonadota bacterium]|nr:FAD-binding oxidoreductase [Pseudomonadota bacterium]